MFGEAPLLVSFWINVVFLLFTHSGTSYAPCRHLFISSGSLSWMDVNFLKQKPCIQSWPSVLHPVWYFLLSFWVNRCVFPVSGLLRALLILFSYYLSIQPFRYVFWLPYSSPKEFGFFCTWLLVWLRVIYSQLLIECSFVALECPVLYIF